MKTVKAIVFSFEGVGIKPRDENREEFELQGINYSGQNFEEEAELRVAHIFRTDRTKGQEETTKIAIQRTQELASQEPFDYAIVFACFAEHHRAGTMELIKLIEASGAKEVVAVMCATWTKEEIYARSWFEVKVLDKYEAMRHLRELVIEDHDFQCRDEMQYAIQRYLKGEI